jgi:hypothetical protein
VKRREDLDMQLRGKYIDIYYDGGCALRVGANSMTLDKNYFATGADDDRCQRRDAMIAKAKAHDFNRYFDATDGVIQWIQAWVKKHGRNERKKQHFIACSNRAFTSQNNLVVIDIEYAVSILKPYNHTVTKDKQQNEHKKVPKFDIIAVDKEGQLYVIELKDNLSADQPNSRQNVDAHQDDFKQTVMNSYGTDDSFVSEMCNVLNQKQTLGLLPDGIHIHDAAPKFAIAYSGDSDDLNQFTENHPKILTVDICKESETKLYLQLKTKQ